MTVVYEVRLKGERENPEFRETKVKKDIKFLQFKTKMSITLGNWS